MEKPTVYVIVEEGGVLLNISATAVYSSREQAEAHLTDPNRNWYADRAKVIPLILDSEA
jgi:hypothetical protein